MYKILTKEICLKMRKNYLVSPEAYNDILYSLLNEYNILYDDAIRILTGNIDEILVLYDFDYDSLLKVGFNSEQINQILKAKENGLNLSFVPVNTPVEELRKIRYNKK